MVEWMSMFETVVQVALVTSHTDHFLLLTAALGAFICKNLWGEKQLSRNSFYRDIIFSLLPFWGRPTFRFLWAGSDLQSLSICSPTVMSGISPLLMGMGVLHNGHTGTWISCTRKQTCQPQPVCFKHWLKYTTGQDYYSYPPSYMMKCTCDLHKLCGLCRKFLHRHHISLEGNLQ